MSKYFPNGFTDWYETFYEVVQFITLHEDLRNKLMRTGGTGLLYETAEQLTDEFEELYKDENWEELSFFEEIDNFLINNYNAIKNN